MADVQHGTNF